MVRAHLFQSEEKIPYTFRGTLPVLLSAFDSDEIDMDATPLPWLPSPHLPCLHTPWHLVVLRTFHPAQHCFTSGLHQLATPSVGDPSTNVHLSFDPGETTGPTLLSPGGLRPEATDCDSSFPFWNLCSLAQAADFSSHAAQPPAGSPA